MPTNFSATTGSLRIAAFLAVVVATGAVAKETIPQPIEEAPAQPPRVDPFAELPLHRLPVSDRPPIDLPVVAQLAANGPGKECSGVVSSRQWNDTYWMINDSGDEPRVYAITVTGEDYVKSRNDGTLGVLLGGAINVDWEDITTDDSGSLIVCDVGNNRNDRRDLTLYYVPEPSPVASRAIPSHTRRIEYPDQWRFPAPENDFNFDCEGVFSVGADVFFVSKHRSGKEARIYRLPALDRHHPAAACAQVESLEPVARFIPHGQITGADATADGLRLALTTYDQIWLLERESRDDSWFEGAIATARFVSPQIESVCFTESGDELLLADEKTAKLMRIGIDALTAVRDSSDASSIDPAAEQLAEGLESDSVVRGSGSDSARGETPDLWGEQEVAVGTTALLPTVEDMESFTPGAWTMVVFPDTQYYVDQTRKIPPTPEVFRSMSQWVANHKEERNIGLVLHVGDIVDNDDPAEYESALQALRPIRGVVPTIVCTGNHEYAGNAEIRRTQFNSFFRPETDPLIDPAKGGILRETFVDGSIENAIYEYIAPDGRPLLIVSLEWGTRDAVVDWANDIVARPRYKDHTGILLTHAYLYHDDTRYDYAKKGRSQSANPLRYGTAATGDSSDGQMIWDQLVRKRSNFEMVFCGHVSGHKAERMALGSAAEVGYLVSPGISGNRVHQLLFNAQRRGDAGDGWMRLLEFQPDGRTVVVKTYSPHRDQKGLDCWRTDADDHFQLQLDPR